MGNEFAYGKLKCYLCVFLKKQTQIKEYFAISIYLFFLIFFLFFLTAVYKSNVTPEPLIYLYVFNDQTMPTDLLILSSCTSTFYTMSFDTS